MECNLDTKGKIIKAAIDEFADKGYDDASIRKIAEIVGIKGSSIYNHFKSKEEILEEIFKYYRNVFYQGEVVFEANIETIEEGTIPNNLKQGLYQVIETFKKPEMFKIIKIIFKEQFKNQIITNFILEEFIIKPRQFMEQFMSELIKNKIIKEENPQLLSQEFHSFAIYKMYEEFMLKGIEHINFDELKNEINEHIDFFWNSIKK